MHRARRQVGARDGRRGRPSAGTSRTVRRPRIEWARPTTSTRCRRSPPRPVGGSYRSGLSKWCEPRQLSPIVASTASMRATLPTPPHWATSQPPRRVIVARFAKSASWSGTQWKVAVDTTASTGSSIGNGWPRSATTYSMRSPNGARRSRAASIIAGDPSRAMTRPSGSRDASCSVTRPVPQPASRTRSSPSSGSRSSTARPQRVIGSATRS